MYRKIRFYGLAVLLIVFLMACNLAAAAGALPEDTATPTESATSTATSTPTPSETPTPTPTATPTEMPTATDTPTTTLTPSVTSTPTETPTPTITPSPTYSLPRITVKMQANCRYGPAKAYLYAWGMYAGDTGTVWGRNASGTWLWIQPDNINYPCWIAASVVDVVGDIFTVRVAPVVLPHSTLYGPPGWVTATRNGDQVIVTWEKVNMTEDDDRGYLIEAYVCLSGNLVFTVVATNETTYTFTDEPGCDSPSHGLLYTVEKHGYTDPVQIPWP